MSSIVFQYDRDFARVQIFKELDMIEDEDRREKIIEEAVGEKTEGKRWYGYDVKPDNKDFPSLPALASFAKVFKKPIEYFLYNKDTFNDIFKDEIIKIPYIYPFTKEDNSLIYKKEKYACMAKQKDLLTISKNPYDLVVMKQDGDTMDTTIRSGSEIMIDTKKRKITDGGIFAFNTYEIKNISIRRLFIKLDKILIIADNKNLYETCTATPKNINIIGRIVALKYFFVRCENH